MPSFSFSVTKKPTKVNSSSQSVNKYDIILADVEGTIFINITGKYQVVIGLDKYDIASECYSCKGVSEIYEQVLTNGLTRTLHIRSERDRDDRDRTMYLPFTAGCSVKGNIVRHKAANVVIFKIKKVFINATDDEARKAIKFYRDNYDQIRKALAKDWLDNHKVEDNQIVIEDIVEKDG